MGDSRHRRDGGTNRLPTYREYSTTTFQPGADRVESLDVALAHVEPIFVDALAIGSRYCRQSHRVQCAPN